MEHFRCRIQDTLEVSSDVDLLPSLSFFPVAPHHLKICCRCEMNKKYWHLITITLSHSTAKSWAESPESASGLAMDFNSAYNNYCGLIDWKNLIKLTTGNEFRFSTDEDYRQSMLLQAFGNLKIKISNSIKSSYFDAWVDTMDGGCPLRVQLWKKPLKWIHDSQKFFQLLNLRGTEGGNLPRAEVPQHLTQGVTRVAQEVKETPTHDDIRPPTWEIIWDMKNKSVSTLFIAFFLA